MMLSGIVFQMSGQSSESPKFRTRKEGKFWKDMVDLVLTSLNVSLMTSFLFIVTASESIFSLLRADQKMNTKMECEGCHIQVAEFYLYCPCFHILCKECSEVASKKICDTCGRFQDKVFLRSSPELLFETINSQFKMMVMDYLSGAEKE